MATIIRAEEPLSSGDFDIHDLDRLGDISERQEAIAKLLTEMRLDAMLISRPENFAWFTGGADATRHGSADPAARLFLTKEARVLVTNNVESQYLFDRELPGLGFQLKERPWFEPAEQLARDLCRGRSVGSDDGFGESVNLGEQLAAMRPKLTAREVKTIRQLGREVTHAVEATARACKLGDTEAEIAAELAHRLVKHQITPVRLQVCADGRFRRYPHYPYGAERLNTNCIIAAVGRRHGLHVACCRAVMFGEDESFRNYFHKATLMQSTGLYFSRGNVSVADVWPKVRRIYEKFGCPDEWQMADQAEVMGYAACEKSVLPTSDFVLSAGMAMHWHPAVGPALTGDTVLLRDGAPELLTVADEWPQILVTVKGEGMRRPDVLVRPV